MHSFRKILLAVTATLPLIVVSHTARAQDIVDTAQSAGQFNTLLQALEAADLADALREDGPYTVFAPTDEAFAALPEGTLEELLKPENRDQLVEILTYHVASGRILSTDIEGNTVEVESVEGTSLSVDARDGVTVEGANVVSADIEADNGVIHVIDRVVMPNQ